MYHVWLGVEFSFLFGHNIILKYKAFVSDPYTSGGKNQNWKNTTQYTNAVFILNIDHRSLDYYLVMKLGLSTLGW